MKIMKKSIIIWTVAIILVAVAVYTTYQYNSNPAPLPNPTTESPKDTTDQSSGQEEVVTSMDALDFTLEDMNGNKVSLSDYKGKTIFLNFWASWCGPCKYEMPFIEQLYQETKDSDLVIITVNLQESKSTVSNFLTDNKYTFPVWLDTEGDVANQYGVSGIPLSLLINKEFKIVSAHEGYMNDLEMMKSFVDQLKEEKQ
jgi:thiol-disulfide isomerase/thioredoxin